MINLELIENKFTCNGGDCKDDKLFVDHNIPMVFYNGLSIQQHHKIGGPFSKLIGAIKPTTVIEIGTAAGGLTLMLRDLLNEHGLNETTLITYDVIEPGGLINKVKSDGLTIDVRVEDIFSGDDLKNEEYVRNLIQSEGTTLVICDGGNKVKEFNILSNYLKKGDIIMAHDYSFDEEYYQKNIHNKIWYWNEIRNSDIEQSCEKNNLFDFMSEFFNKVVWCCKIKV